MTRGAVILVAAVLVLGGCGAKEPALPPADPASPSFRSVEAGRWLAEPGLSPTRAQTLDASEIIVDHGPPSIREQTLPRLAAVAIDDRRSAAGAIGPDAGPHRPSAAGPLAPVFDPSGRIDVPHAAPSPDQGPTSEPPRPAPRPAFSFEYDRRGFVLTLPDTLFHEGSAQLRPDARRAIDAIVAQLGPYPGRAVLIESHTDSNGTAPANFTLSRLRARALEAALVRRGIALERISARAYGEAYPVASNATAEGRATNRRIEIVLVDPGESVENSFRERFEASAGDLSPY